MANLYLTQQIVALDAFHSLHVLLKERGVEQLNLLPPLTGEMPQYACYVADEESGLKMLVTFRVEPPCMGNDWSRRITLYVKDSYGTHFFSEEISSDDFSLDLELFREKILIRPLTMLVDLLASDTPPQRHSLEPAEIRVQRILDLRKKQEAS